VEALPLAGDHVRIVEQRLRHCIGTVACHSRTEGVYVAGREIVVWKVLRDIRSGLDDSSLKEKYRLSNDGLQNLYEELLGADLLEKEGTQYFVPQKRRIGTREIVSDIRSGFTDLDLMEKYKLSSRGLQRVFTKLLDAGALLESDISGRDSPYRDSVTLKKMRGSIRSLPILSVGVYRRDNPNVHGRIRDLSEDGVGVLGLTATVGEVTTLVFMPDEALEIAQFSVQAKCRWFRHGEAGATCSAGFEITHISNKNFSELQKLLQLMTLSFSDDFF
jgi:uncharacterized protein (DUF433 family)